MLITMLIIAIILSAVGINMIRMQKEDEARRKRRKEVEKTLIQQRREMLRWTSNGQLTC